MFCLLAAEERREVRWVCVTVEDDNSQLLAAKELLHLIGGYLGGEQKVF